MQHLELSKILKKMTPPEWRQLQKMARSPFFNQRDDVRRLLDFLIRGLETDLAPTQEAATEAVFESKNGFEKEMRYVISWSLGLVRRFLAIAEMERDAGRAELFLAESLRRRGLDEQADRSLAAFLETQKGAARSVSELSARLEAEQLLLENRQKARRGERLDFQKSADAMDARAVAETLRLACSARAVEGMTGRRQPIRFLGKALELAENEPFLQAQPLVQAFLAAFRMLEGGPFSVQNFEKLKAAALAEPPMFDQSERRELWQLALHFSIRRQNQGEAAFAREAFDFYEKGIAANVLVERRGLSRQAFTNAHLLGLRLGETDWAADFLEKGAEKLPASERASVVAYNRALQFFRKKDFEKVLETLREAELDDVFEALDARRMLAVSFFERGEMASLRSLLDAFAQFLKRQRNLGYHRQSYLNFIFLMRKMLDLERLSVKKRARLRSKIESLERVAEREWLLAKLA